MTLGYTKTNTSSMSFRGVRWEEFPDLRVVVAYSRVQEAYID